MMQRTFAVVLTVVFTASWTFPATWAAGASRGEKPTGSASAALNGEGAESVPAEGLLFPARPSRKVTPPKDAVDLAFALPKGVVLNAKQKKEFEKLKEEKGALLRAAVDRVQNGSAEEKRPAAKQVQDLRFQIKLAVQQIINMPAMEAQQKANMEAAKKRAEARKQKKKKKNAAKKDPPRKPKR